MKGKLTNDKSVIKAREAEIDILPVATNILLAPSGPNGPTGGHTLVHAKKKSQCHLVAWHLFVSAVKDWYCMFVLFTAHQERVVGLGVLED